MSAPIKDYGSSRDGILQLRRHWLATPPARAVVYLLHGIVEHSGRYDRVGATLAAAGYEVVATDLRGHGRSGGRRGHIGSWSEYLDDVEDQLTELDRLDLPVVLLGHSMGGLIALSYCLEERPQPDLLVVSGPALHLGAGTLGQQTLLALAPVVSLLAPGYSIPARIDPDLLSTDPVVGEAFMADPLRCREITVSLAGELLAAMERVRGGMAGLSLPTLCLHGADDRLVATDCSEIIESAASAQRRVYQGLRHEIFNEPTGAALLADVVDWIDAGLTSTPA